MKLSTGVENFIIDFIFSNSANGREITETFINFGTEVDPDHVQDGGYCGMGGKRDFTRHYVGVVNEEEKLQAFLAYYFEPSKFHQNIEELKGYLAELNNALKFDDIQIELYDHDRKLKYKSLNQTGDGSSTSTFFKGDEIKSEIISALSTAEKSILINMYRINHKEIMELLLEKSAANVDVQIIIDNNDDNKRFIDSYDVDFLVMPVMGWDQSRANNHHKYFIIDDKTLLHGTANATYAAFGKNSENISISDDHLEIEKFRKHFIETKRSFLKK